MTLEGKSKMFLAANKVYIGVLGFTVLGGKPALLYLFLLPGISCFGMLSIFHGCTLLVCSLRESNQG